jgi:hypothetical protein
MRKMRKLSSPPSSRVKTIDFSSALKRAKATRSLEGARRVAGAAGFVASATYACQTPSRFDRKSTFLRSRESCASRFTNASTRAPAFGISSASRARCASVRVVGSAAGTAGGATSAAAGAGSGALTGAGAEESVGVTPGACAAHAPSPTASPTATNALTDPDLTAVMKRIDVLPSPRTTRGFQAP